MDWKAMLAIAAAIALPLSLLPLLAKKPPRKIINTPYDQWLEDEQTAWPRRMFWRGMIGFGVVMAVGLPLAGLWIWAFGS